mgnify:CR=1 FL=1
MASLHVDVVSAEEEIFSGEAKLVALPGESGELGILPRHAPLITRIKAGAVRIRVPGEEAINVAEVLKQGGGADWRSVLKP